MLFLLPIFPIFKISMVGSVYLTSNKIKLWKEVEMLEGVKEGVGVEEEVELIKIESSTGDEITFL